MNTSNTPAGRPHFVDTDALLRSGAVEGPFRPCRPITLTWRTRIKRAVRRLLDRL